MAVRRCDGWQGYRSSRQDYLAAKRIESARVLWPVRLEPARLVHNTRKGVHHGKDHVFVLELLELVKRP